MVLEIIEAVLTNVASHHSTMLAIGSILAILPGLLTMFGYPEEDKHKKKETMVNIQGEAIEVEIDRSRPRMHFYIRVIGFAMGAFSAYSGYLTIITASQDVATAGLLFSNSAMLMSRTASKYRWAFPVSMAAGGAAWLQILRLLNATPDLLVNAIAIVFLSVVFFVPTLYAERGVKTVGEVMNRSAPAIVVGSIGGFQAVALALGGSLGVIPPFILEWIINLTSTFGGV